MRQDALRCLAETSCAAVMSAEALLEKPDLFMEDDQAQWAISERGKFLSTCLSSISESDLVRVLFKIERVRWIMGESTKLARF